MTRGAGRLTYEIRVRGEYIAGAVERFRAIGLAVLKRNDLYSGKLLFDRFLKTLFTLVGRNRTGLHPDYCNLPLTPELFSKPFSTCDSTLPIVSRNV